MKKFSILSVIGLLALLTACGTTQEPATNAQNNSRGKSNTQMETSAGRAPAQTNSRGTSTSQNTSSSTAAETSAKAEAVREANKQEMYAELQMDKTQIKRYESAWKSEMDSYNRINQNKNMNAYERAESQDKIMRDILNETQLEKYQQWAREHANSFGE